MNTRTLPLACCLLAVAPWATALGADPPAGSGQGAPTPPDITMRIIENPDAMAPEAITRRLALPAAPAREARSAEEAEEEAGKSGAAPGGEADARERAREASERGREFGEEAAERARDMSDRAADQREDFGRSRAEEMRPERPEPPRPPRP
jgi:hypothetical protein